MVSSSLSKLLTSRSHLPIMASVFVIVSTHTPPIDPEFFSASVAGPEALAFAPARQGGSDAGGLRERGKMALDGPEQVWRLRRPGGNGGSMTSRRDLRWAAGRGKRVGWVGWVGGGWTNPDWALPGTGSAVSAPPPAGQSRAERKTPWKRRE